MKLLTDDEHRALYATHDIKELDSYRALIFLGKLPTLTVLLNAVISHSQSSDPSPRVKMVSDIASAIALGNVWEFKEKPEHLMLLTEFVAYAHTINLQKQV